MVAHAKKAKWRELVALAKHVPLMPTVSTDVIEYGPTNGITVFVHGYLATGGVLRPLGEFLGKTRVAPRQVHFTFSPTGSLAEHARRLDELVKRARRPGDDGPVHLVGHSLGGLLAQRKEMARSVGQHASGLGQLHPLGRAHEQCDPQFVFQGLDVARQRGLRHVQALGRSADMAFFCHRQKQTKPASVLQCSHPSFHTSMVSDRTDMVLDGIGCPT